jgi:thiamine pyrophosphate-dependent acetolactate synthase large subunit-like protein
MLQAISIYCGKLGLAEVSRIAQDGFTLIYLAAPADIATLRDWVEGAARPLALCGRALDRPGGREALRVFLEQWNLPAVVSFRSHDLLPNTHRLYAGDMGLANPPDQMAVLRRADLLLVLGARITDITSQGYTYPDLVRPRMRLAHVHPDPSAIGTHFAADLAIACDPRELIAALGAPSKPAPPAQDRWIEELAAERRKIATPRRFNVNDGVAFEDVVALVGRNLAEDAIVTADAGMFGAPVYRVIPFAPPQRLLAPIVGAMGFGIPAAVAASLREPAREVICFVGDGGFLMTGNELAVAMARKLPLKVIVSENRSYASIWVQQERDYPGRSVGTMFANPDLALIGRAFGFETTRTSDPGSAVTKVVESTPGRAPNGAASAPKAVSKNYFRDNDGEHEAKWCSSKRARPGTAGVSPTPCPLASLSIRCDTRACPRPPGNGSPWPTASGGCTGAPSRSRGRPARLRAG